MPGHRRAEATPFFERLWPGMTTEKCRSTFQSKLWGAHSSRNMFLIGGLIHHAAEFVPVRDLQLEEPGAACGVRIDQRRLAREFVVDFQHLARNRRVDVGG